MDFPQNTVIYGQIRPKTRKKEVFFTKIQLFSLKKEYFLQYLVIFLFYSSILNIFRNNIDICLKCLIFDPNKN